MSEWWCGDLLSKPILLNPTKIKSNPRSQWGADEVGPFPYWKRLSQALFKTWLNDGLLAEIQCLELSLVACSTALNSSMVNAADVEVWQQLARTQQFLGKSSAGE